MIAITLVLCLFTHCDTPIETQTLPVTATAYVTPSNTNKTYLGAWGDTLKPGVKAIAVSRDLLQKGLTYGDEVAIEGLEGTFRVMDKMHARWNDKIDIYMGHDKQAARDWGKQKVIISWVVEAADD